ncbi:hypothetical protein NLI96_g916 [Meripilus lineatus]|uniref:Phosphoglycerate mutase-like protein n=1 Tax=Meripilus lineatus TaxID=2056292 RepID=A0AAD5VDF2_9APHY|nr:hypothetical protein NLI96_g916 [Physisporinus lineatus]
MEETTNEDTVLGVVLLTRHGDRTTFFQNPRTYAASQTSITPLGEQQEFELGALLRSLYLDQDSPTFIEGISPSTSVVRPDQIIARADAGDEGGVIFDSTIALLQGLFPATHLSNITLANGTTVISPLGGYQYVPVETVEPDQDVSLQGFTSCNTLNIHTAGFYRSERFKEKARESREFLSKLAPFLDGRPATLENMVFDYVNVQSIHNATYAQLLPPTFLEQARDLANFHEHGVFTDTDLDGIGNIAARTVLPSILTAFKRIANPFNALKFHYSSVSYKPFLSLFNMIGVNENGEIPPAIVNYAAAVVFEIRLPSRTSHTTRLDSSESESESQSHSGLEGPLGLEPVVRFKFKNGTDDETFVSHPMSFSGWNPGVVASRENIRDVPLSVFIRAFEDVSIQSKPEWCRVCGQTIARGCDELLCHSASQSSIASESQEGTFSRSVFKTWLVGGVESSGTSALAVFVVLFAVVTVFWGVRCGRGRKSEVVTRDEKAKRDVSLQETHAKN